MEVRDENRKSLQGLGVRDSIRGIHRTTEVGPVDVGDLGMKTPDTLLTRTVGLVSVVMVLAVPGVWAAASEGDRTTIPALVWFGGGAALVAAGVLMAWQARRLVQLNRQLREAKTAIVQGAFGHYLDPQVVEHLVESANLADRLGVEERVMTAFF